VLFLKYEDLKSDLGDQVARIAEFMGYRMTAELLEKVKDATSFEKMRVTEFSGMKEIEELGGFFRKGYVGSWREHFSPEQDEILNQIIEQRLAGTGLEFDFG